MWPRCWWSRIECPKAIVCKFGSNEELNSRDTNSPRIQVREQVIGILEGSCLVLSVRRHAGDCL